MLDGVKTLLHNLASLLNEVRQKQKPATVGLDELKDSEFINN